jgi:hypothetical protein
MATGGGWISSQDSSNGKINFGSQLRAIRTQMQKAAMVQYSRVQTVISTRSRAQAGPRADLLSVVWLYSFLNGTGVVQKIDMKTGVTVDSWGNAKISIAMTDGDYKIAQNRKADAIAISITDSSSNVLFQWGTTASQVLIGNGNIVVRSK